MANGNGQKVTPPLVSMGKNIADYIRIGDDFYNQNKFNLAIMAYGMAIILGSSDPVVYFNRACAYMTRGKYEEAANDFGTYLKWNPNDTEARGQLEIAQYLSK